MPNITINMQPLHPAQIDVNTISNANKLTVVRAGRRFGKTTWLEQKAASRAIRKSLIGWFTPNYKLQAETYRNVYNIVSPLIESSNKTEGVIRLVTGGKIEFWSLDNEDAGRSRKYNLAVIDEASLVKKGMRERWEQAIRPTLLDMNGDAIMAGTPKGVDPENFFYAACTDKTLGWQEFHAPSRLNPNLSQEALARIEQENPPLVYRQEYLAEFVDWSGDAFFNLQNMLEDGAPYEIPQYAPHFIFAVIDTATKTGKEHDGTAVVWFAMYKWPEPKLVILNYDIVQIMGHILESWIPSVMHRCEQYAETMRPIQGIAGIFIEDKNSGTILIHQAQNKGIPASAIDSKLTSVGKDERAISVSGYFHTGKVKLSKEAYNNVMNYKGIMKNHLVSQVCGFHIGVDNGADDLVDCVTYGAALALGDAEGY